jgi:patatin-like phospholipase/acyl hydrolase
MRKRFVLSIDGGGIRGLIPSVLLSSLKEKLENYRLNKPFHEIFDLMAGTSTGGLIALALSVPLYRKTYGEPYDEKGGVSADKLPFLYESLGDKAFPGSQYQVWKILRQLFMSKYSSVPFQQILNELFKECTVKMALTNILITTFDMKSMTPVFIKRRPLFAGGGEDPDFYMSDAALSTAAVPTYFPPAYVESVNGANGDFCLVDGGVFCINPALSALIETRKMYPYAEYVILSLGTGVQIEEYKTETIKKWGFFNWIAPWLRVPLIAAVGDGQRISTNHMLKKLPQVTLYRIDINLDRGKGAMDDGSRENLCYLWDKAYEMMDLHKETIDRFVKEVTGEYI